LAACEQSTGVVLAGIDVDGKTNELMVHLDSGVQDRDGDSPTGVHTWTDWLWVVLTLVSVALGPGSSGPSTRSFTSRN